MTKNSSYKNIRATGLREFWGKEYEESIYLWEGAKHDLTISEDKSSNIPVLEDLFFQNKDIERGNRFTREIYKKYISILAKKLNEIHQLDLKENFWRTVFGYWLWRHICIVYEKYEYLSKIDIDKTSIKLLDIRSFFIPNDHIDYLFCFCNDFGVQQLVSQYYFLFKTKEFDTRNKKFRSKKSILLEKKINISKVEKIESKLREFLKVLKDNVFQSEEKLVRSEAEIVILGDNFTPEIINLLSKKSAQKIQKINLPEVKKNIYKSDFQKRKQLCEIQTDNDFEYFLVRTFFYCMPKILMENFLLYYKCFIKDIKRMKFKYIASEIWISDMPISIYIAIAQKFEKNFIVLEHGSGTVLINKNNQAWMDFLASYLFLTAGWMNKEKYIVQGGYCNHRIETYSFMQEKKNILFVTYTRFPFLMAINKFQESNKKFKKHLKRIDQFLTNLPDKLKENFIFRAREIEGFWNVGKYLELKKKNIKSDNIKYFQDSIMNSRIVVIDHLSTGFSEILMNEIPFLIFSDKELDPLNSEILEIIDRCKKYGIFHTTVESLINHLNDVYENVLDWWNNISVQEAVNNLKSKMLAPPEKTVEFFLSCLNENKDI